MRALLFWLLVPIVATAAPVQIQGSLLAHDGKPPIAGVVRVTSLSRTGIVNDATRTNPPSDPHVVDAKGNFSFTLQTPGFYALWFEAPQHEGALVPLWVDDSNRRARSVTVRLTEAAPPPVGSMVKVGYSDGGATKLEPMARQSDGSWTYSAPSSSSSVRYVLELVVPNDINVILNPSEPKVSTENEKHHVYLQSLAEVKDGRFSIRFDPKDLPHGVPGGHAQVTLSDPTDAKLFALLDEIHSGFVKLTAEHPPMRDREGWGKAWKELQTKELERLWAKSKDSKASAKVRAAAAVLLMHLPSDPTPAQAHELVKLAPPESLAWAVWPMARGTYLQQVHLSREDTLQFLRDTLKKNPDRELQGNALAALAKAEEDAGHAEAAAAMFRRVSSEYSDLPGLSLSMSTQRKTFPLMGKAFPPIELADLTGKRPGKDAFKGRFTLVEFSALGCGACTSLIPELRKLREAVPSDKLQMITVTLGVDTREYQELLAKEPPQEWQHFALPESQDSLLNRWDVTYYPTLYLVDAKGVVIATDKTLRGTGKPLTETVGAFLSPVIPARQVSAPSE